MVDRISGGLFGMLVGDALGVPYEFFPPSSLPKYRELEMHPPEWFRRSHARTPPGTWSDDGAQALCLASSLLECDTLDVDDLGKRLLSWFERGYMAVDQRVFDCGAGTKMAFERMNAGVSATFSGGDANENNGNGSLMRVLPLALWHRGSLVDMVKMAHLQSAPTHRHPVSQVCCAFYCLVARAMLCGRDDINQIWDDAERTLRHQYAGNRAFENALEQVVESPLRDAPEGKGYVVDSLWTARWALQKGDYEAVVKHAISLGHDTDTSACIAGGLAGIRDGVAAIPGRWLQLLRGDGWVDPIANQLRHRERAFPLDTTIALMAVPTEEQTDNKKPTSTWLRLIEQFDKLLKR